MSRVRELIKQIDRSIFINKKMLTEFEQHFPEKKLAIASYKGMLEEAERIKQMAYEIFPIRKS